MVVKSDLKLVKNLHQKKYRNQLQLFLAEGVKTVKELLRAGFRPHSIYCTDKTMLEDFGSSAKHISTRDLQRISALKTPNTVLGVFEIPAVGTIPEQGWLVALDGIQDPGNLGTIIRLCDWFGIGDIVCSEHTVDCFNPKVIQATMGSIARVVVHYRALPSWLGSEKRSIFGTGLEGSNLYKTEMPSEGILVIGSESHGISSDVLSVIQTTITIPCHEEAQAESLNAAMATAICLSEIRRSDYPIQK